MNHDDIAVDASIEAVSDSICMMEKKNFFSAVSIRHADYNCLQIVDIGDLIVIEDDEKVPTKERFERKKPWRLAQVIGFYFSGPRKRVLVECLWPYDSVKGMISDKSIFKNDRPTLLLFRKPQIVVDDFPISNIQPVRVKLARLDQSKPRVVNEDHKLGIEEWSFQSRNFAIEEDGTVVCVDEGFTSGTPPSPVLEAWQQLPDHIVKNTAKLGKKFLKQYQRQAEERFQLMPDEESSVQGEVGKRKREEISEPKSRKRSGANPSTKGLSTSHDAQQRSTSKKRKVPHRVEEAKIAKKAAPLILTLGPVIYKSRQKKLEFFHKYKLSGGKGEFKIGDIVSVSYGNQVGQILSIFRSASTVSVELRWFYSSEEELPEGVVIPRNVSFCEEVIEVDEYVGKVHAANVSGKVRLSSTQKEGCLLCRYSFSGKNFSGVEELEAITHWNGKNHSTRGLDCPKAWPGKIPNLLAAYAIDQGEDASVISSLPKKWSREHLELETAVPNPPKLHTCGKRSYWSSLKCRLDSSRSIYGIQRSLTVQIGDVVCIAWSQDNSSECKPFTGPWRVAQILCIYHDDENPTLKLELRWFRRRSEFSTGLLEWIPKCSEVFETAVVESDVDASLILGGVQLFFSPELGKRDRCAPNLLQIPFTCTYFASDNPTRFQQIPTAGFDRSSLFHRLTARGLSKSLKLKEDQLLSQAVSFHLDRTDDSKEIPSLISTISSFASQYDDRLETAVDNVILFVSCPGSTSIQKFCEDSILSHFAVSDCFQWRIKVGDVVAIESPSELEKKPFSVSWIPAQVVAIYSDRSDQKATRRIQIRELRLSNNTSDFVDGLPQIFSTDVISPTSFCPSQILGPVHILPMSETDRLLCPQHLVWDAHFPGIPSPLFVYCGNMSSADGAIENVSLGNLIPDGFKLSQYYDEQSRTKLLDLMCNESFCLNNAKPQLPLVCLKKSMLEKAIPSVDDVSESDDPSNLCSRVRFQGPPILSDNGCDFFDRMIVTPPRHIRQQRSEAQKQWVVLPGELVILHYGGKSGGKPVYVRASDVGDRVFPGSWAVGEVVAMWTRLGDAELEIRWFYRPSELPKHQTSTRHKKAELQCEEIFESDLYDVIPASCIWAPTRLHSEQREVTPGLEYLGMPMVEFFCRQSWSVVRRCRMPLNRIDHRAERGRESSPTIRNNPSLKLLLGRTSTPESGALADQTSPKDWRKAFKDVIEKLSLTDASKETSNNLSAIIGRKKEKNDLHVFIRDAVEGCSISGKHPSLFLAGPPGTGKTAVSCQFIRAV